MELESRVPKIYIKRAVQCMLALLVVLLFFKLLG